MKVKATFRHVIEVTREVEVDEESFTEWAQKRYGDGFDVDLALACWCDWMDTEWAAEVFSDWRIDQPLPSDFELQYSEVIDATPALPDTKENGDD